jgi:Leucine-rich repeat (LRR) protein
MASLAVAENGLTERSLETISRLIWHPSRLRELDLSTNRLTNKVTLFLTSQGWSSAGSDERVIFCLAKALPEGLPNHTYDLADLNLDEGVKELFTLDKLVLSLSKLHLDGNDLNGRGFYKITKMLAHPQCVLAELSLSRCSLHDDAAAALAQGLEESKGLRQLNLSHNLLRDEGVHYLAKSISQYPLTLKDLDISYNQITVSSQFSRM